MLDADVIVIGSGPAGVHAAQTVLEAGKTVLMIDGGRAGPNMNDQPEGSFSDVRRTDEQQWQWFLGKDLSAIALDGLTGGLGGGQISGNRAYVARMFPEELPLEVENGIVIQSLARGGLGAGWGAACAFSSSAELTAMGLPASDMERYYEVIGRRIGMSGPATYSWIQPHLPLDHHAVSAATYAEKNATRMRARRWKAVQPHSAILTEDLGQRKASALTDMDYWSDPHGSVYRPEHTLEVLMQMPGFRYIPGKIVRTIRKESTEMIVQTEAIYGLPKSDERFTARRCVLACNAVNTARILLASLNIVGRDVPFLGKPRVFSVCINPHSIGHPGSDRRISLCQYLLIDETEKDGMPRACAQLYSYRSLLLSRLIGSIPLPAPQAMKVAALLSPSLVIADIRFPVTLAHAASLRLEEGRVRIRFPALAREEEHARSAAWKSVRAGLRTMHLPPIRNMTMPEGSSAHYAGTVPHAEAGTYPLTSDADGQSRELPGVYIADASTFRALSPLPYTFTIMANACRVAEKMLHGM